MRKILSLLVPGMTMAALAGCGSANNLLVCGDVLVEASVDWTQGEDIATGKAPIYT